MSEITPEQAAQYAEILSNYMIQTEQSRCLCCLASFSKNEHSLTKGMISGLRKFAQACIRFDLREANPRKTIEMNLQTFELDERSNWTKLRFFGLVAKYKENGIHKDGKGVVTRNGWAFMRGDLAVPKFVRTFRNKIVEKSPETITYKEIMGKSENFPSPDTLFNVPVDGEDMNIVKTAMAKEKKKRAKPRKNPCPNCPTGTIRKEPITTPAPDSNTLYVVGHIEICNRCGWRKEIRSGY